MSDVKQNEFPKKSGNLIRLATFKFHTKLIVEVTIPKSDTQIYLMTKRCLLHPIPIKVLIKATFTLTTNEKKLKKENPNTSKSSDGKRSRL